MATQTIERSTQLKDKNVRAQVMYDSRPTVVPGDVSASEHQVENLSETRNLRLLDRFTEKIAALCDWLAGPPTEERRLFDSEMAKLRQIHIEVRRQLP